MNKYREEFNNQKEAVIKLLKNARGYYEKCDSNYEFRIFDEIIKSVNEDEFSIVLIGEFSAGKSTFLNALMGEKLLPSFTNETTATINYLRHISKAEKGEEGRVYFTDGTVKYLDKVDFETINKYVSANSELGVVNNVDHLDLFLHSKFLEGNVTLVDSPGLNGVADGHREVTESQIEKSSASIFMFKANQPGSETDFKFIGELKNKVKTIIFVLNKIDDIKRSEGETPESVMEKLKENYKIKFPNETSIPEIWGISAYQALVARSKEHLDYRDRNDYTDEEKLSLEEKSRMCEFENRLWQFITQGEKARAMLLSPIEKVISSLNETKYSIQEEVNVLNGKEDANEIAEKKAEVNNQINEINNSIKKVSGDIRSKLNVLISKLEESIESKLENIKNIQIGHLSNKVNLDHLLNFEKDADKQIQNEYRGVLNKYGRDFENGIREIVEENYSEIAQTINYNFNDSKFNININTKYESSQIETELIKEKYDKDIEKLKEERRRKKEELNNSQLNVARLKNLERERDRIEKAIVRQENLKSDCLKMQAPAAQIASEQTYEEYKRDGVTGKIIDSVMGTKKIQKVKNTIVNKDEIEKFEKNKQNSIKEHENQIKKLNEKLKNFRNNEKSVEEYEIIGKNISEEEKKIKEEIDKKEKEFEKENAKRKQDIFNSKKNELKIYFDEINFECLEGIIKEINHKKSLYLELIKSTIANKLNIKLQRKEDELSMLEEKLKSSIDEKNERIEKLNCMEKGAIEILECAVELQSNIESLPINMIHEDLL